MKNATAQGSLGEVPEPALDQVQPGRGRRREMQVEPGMFTQPRFHIGVFVRRVIIDNEVDLQPYRHLLFDGFQKIQELVMAVFGDTRSDDLSRGDLQSGEQSGGAIALVVVRHGFPAALLHRQGRLGAVQRLDGSFFI